MQSKDDYTRGYTRGYSAGKRAGAAHDAIPADQDASEPTYECKSCGTQWLGSKLLPVWGKDGKECQGSMQKVERSKPPTETPPTASGLLPKREGQIDKEPAGGSGSGSA